MNVPEDFKRSVSNTLANARWNHLPKITQKDMADLIGVSKTYISNIERGKTLLPAYILYRYCEILDLSPAKAINYNKNTADNQFLEDYNSLTPDQRSTIKFLIDELKSKNEQPKL